MIQKLRDSAPSYQHGIAMKALTPRSKAKDLGNFKLQAGEDAVFLDNVPAEYYHHHARAQQSTFARARTQHFREPNEAMYRLLFHSMLALTNRRAFRT